MTGGQAIVEALIAQGVRVVFGVISVHNLHLFDALRDAVEAGRIQFIGARHELAAGFMADGYARATGEPGIYVTSSGPGAADSMGAMGESYHSSVPVLQVTTEIEAEWLGQGRGVTHEANHQLEMFASVADFRALPLTVEDAAEQVAQAFEHMRSHHPRPAVVAVPTDLLAEESGAAIPRRRDLAPRQADGEAVAAALRMLERTERPVLWVGSGVMSAGASEELRVLAEALGAPVAIADGGKGAFPEDHPLCLGSALHGRFWGDNPIADFLPTCDVAIIVGSGMHFRSTKGVGLELPGAVIQIDIDEAVFDRNYPASVRLNGDARAVLRQLLEHAHRLPQASEAYREETARLRKLVAEGVRQQYPAESRLFDGIRAVLDRDAIVVADPAIPGYVAQRAFPAYEPGTFFHPHGWVGIGYSFPSSMGAKTGAPTRQVLCISGDGGFQYNMQELGTAVQYGISPIVLLFNDNAWGALQSMQRRSMGGRYFGSDLVNPDFVALAQAYGIAAARVHGADQLLDELEAALARNAISIIEAAIPEGLEAFR